MRRLKWLARWCYLKSSRTCFLNCDHWTVLVRLWLLRLVCWGVYWEYDVTSLGHWFSSRERWSLTRLWKPAFRINFDMRKLSRFSDRRDRTTVTFWTRSLTHLEYPLKLWEHYFQVMENFGRPSVRGLQNILRDGENESWLPIYILTNKLSQSNQSESTKLLHLLPAHNSIIGSWIRYFIFLAGKGVLVHDAVPL